MDGRNLVGGRRNHRRAPKWGFFWPKWEEIQNMVCICTHFSRQVTWPLADSHVTCTPKFYRWTFLDNWSTSSCYITCRQWRSRRYGPWWRENQQGFHFRNSPLTLVSSAPRSLSLMRVVHKKLVLQKTLKRRTTT